MELPDNWQKSGMKLTSEEIFKKTFKYYFPYLSFPIIHQKINDFTNQSHYDCVYSTNIFGVNFVSSGITQEDSLNILYEQITIYILEFVKSFILFWNSFENASIRQSPNLIARHPASIVLNKLENCMKNTNVNSQPKIANSISSLYEYAQRNNILSPDFEFFTSNNLFGCKIKFNDMNFIIEPTFRRKADAKEAACKHIMKELGLIN